MKITFLGTGTSQGIPIIGSTDPVCLSDDPRDKRLRVSVLLEWKGFSYVIDCGPDFRQQMLANQVRRLDGILYTHEHNDHTAGLDDIRPFYFRQGAISIYAKEEVINALRQRFAYIFTIEDKYPSAPDLKVNIIDEAPFMIGDRTVVPIKAMHGKLPVMGYRIGDFAYITDAKTVSEKELEKLKGVKVLAVNALRIEPHPTHFNLKEALAFVEKVRPEKAYFTHISHQMGFHEEVQKQLPQNVFLAYDNLKIKL
ncbi:MAG TPA: MBL fold metallo-hydrolase [Flavobacteriaceae bacterium]|nr:MBL fold metallo-hydrolase [Flavobacteriaceae bacterium]